MLIQPETSDFRLEDFHAVDQLASMRRMAVGDMQGALRRLDPVFRDPGELDTVMVDDDRLLGETQ